jgi:hypothetical protein
VGGVGCAENVAAVAAMVATEEEVEGCGAMGGVADLGGRVGLDGRVG